MLRSLTVQFLFKAFPFDPISRIETDIEIRQIFFLNGLKVLKIRDKTIVFGVPEVIIRSYSIATSIIKICMSDILVIIEIKKHLIFW